MTKDRGNSTQSIGLDSNLPSSQYNYMGTHVKQGAKGITPYSKVLEHVDHDSQQIIIKFIRQIEHLFEMYMDTNEIRIVLAALHLVDGATFSTSYDDDKKARLYGSLAVGENVFLATHTDKDFTYSAVTIQWKGHYGDGNGNGGRVLAYFVFPLLGIAIPLRAGDVLFFNPNEPHCISKRVEDKDRIFCISLYLKYGNIGCNDNSMPLNDTQQELYHHIKKQKTK